MRTSNDEYSNDGRLINGYDYNHQAWVVNGRYVRCNHPEAMKCGCYGRIHEDEETTNRCFGPKERSKSWKYLKN